MVQTSADRQLGGDCLLVAVGTRFPGVGAFSCTYPLINLQEVETAHGQ